MNHVMQPVPITFSISSTVNKPEAANAGRRSKNRLPYVQYLLGGKTFSAVWSQSERNVSGEQQHKHCMSRPGWWWLSIKIMWKLIRLRKARFQKGFVLSGLGVCVCVWSKECLLPSNYPPLSIPTYCTVVLLFWLAQGAKHLFVGPELNM